MQFISRSALLFILFLLLTGHTFACLNGNIVQKLKGDFPVYMEDAASIEPGRILFSVLHYSNGVRQLKQLYTTNKDPDVLSDIGLLLILERRYDKAIALYRNMEQQYPGRYATAANIGTAFELTGQNDSALKWISRAVTINPKSHDSSEWLHVNILKAKIEGPSAINSDFLLGIDFGNDSIPEDLEFYALNKLANAVYYQLNERMSFITWKDPIVAQLLFDYGNMMMMNRAYSMALSLLQSAKEYGYAGHLLEMRMEYCKKGIEKKNDIPVDRNITTFEIYLLSFLTGIVLIPIVLLLRMKH